MSDNKKYYYLKLRDNFFDSDEMVILENMTDGYLYSNILLKLYLKSLKNEGKLMFTDRIPFNSQMLSAIVRQPIGVIEKALNLFNQLKLIEILDNGAIYLLDIQNLIGKSSTEADRIREYRAKIESERTNVQEISYKNTSEKSERTNVQETLNKSTSEASNRTNVQGISYKNTNKKNERSPEKQTTRDLYKCTPERENRDKRIENRDKERESRESKKDDSLFITYFQNLLNLSLKNKSKRAMATQEFLKMSEFEKSLAVIGSTNYPIWYLKSNPDDTTGQYSVNAYQFIKDLVYKDYQTMPEIKKRKSSYANARDTVIAEPEWSNPNYDDQMTDEEVEKFKRQLGEIGKVEK